MFPVQAIANPFSVLSGAAAALRILNQEESPAMLAKRCAKHASVLDGAASSLQDLHACTWQRQLHPPQILRAARCLFTHVCGPCLFVVLVFCWTRRFPADCLVRARDLRTQASAAAAELHEWVAPFSAVRREIKARCVMSAVIVPTNHVD